MTKVIEMIEKTKMRRFSKIYHEKWLEIWKRVQFKGGKLLNEQKRGKIQP